MRSRETPKQGSLGQDITFSFGDNWLNFIQAVSEETVAGALRDLDRWIGIQNIAGKSVIDIGCGSGLSSIAFARARCRRLVSIDADPLSIKATTQLRLEYAPRDVDWDIQAGSITDDAFVSEVGTFDIVYSWGVLHHTGTMWQAIDNAARLCRPEGLFWISIYSGGPRYPSDLELKRSFNAANLEQKQAMITTRVQAEIDRRKSLGLDPDQWNAVKERGMSVYYDIIDWLGGLPYEVARPSEILVYCRERGFSPIRVLEVSEGGCSIYLFKNAADACAADGIADRFEYASEGSTESVARSIHDQLVHDFAQADAAYNETERVWRQHAAKAEIRAAASEGGLQSGSVLLRGAMRWLSIKVKTALGG